MVSNFIIGTMLSDFSACVKVGTGSDGLQAVLQRIYVTNTTLKHPFWLELLWS